MYSYYGKNDYRNYLAHYGIKGMKWGVRHDKRYSKSSKRKQKVNIGKRFISKVYASSNKSTKITNYDILDPSTGEYFKLVEGSRITNQKVFAGKGSKKKLKPEVAEGLTNQYGGKPENWQHVKGIAQIDYHGEPREAEIHWFQEKTAGKHKHKIKQWREN